MMHRVQNHMTTFPGSGLDWLLEQLWSPIVAVTAAHGGRANGLISSTVLTASLLPEAPRISVQLGKPSLTHDLALAAGAFAVQLLPADERGLELFRALGTRTGHDAPKLDEIPTRTGVTGSPILEDAVAYLEARVAATLDTDETTVVVAEVVTGARDPGPPYLTIELVRERLPPEWAAEWERRREREIREARLLRSRR
jgi:flavin reductase (DIM6/NTAB) family NADH-FMN oxidoreductase RutF